MVAFGRALVSCQRSEWQEAYLDYQGLKALVADPAAAATFDKQLRLEIEKVSLFALYRQGEIARAIGALRLQQSPGLFGSARQDSDDNDRLQQAQAQQQQQQQLLHSYTACAVELLHWQRFVCINAVGIRKIIKKFHKNHHHPAQLQQDSHNEDHHYFTTDPHLQQLANSQAVAAMHASLEQACRELDDAESVMMILGQQAHEPQDPSTVQQRQAWTRLHCAVSLIQAMRHYAHSMNTTFLAFLSHKSMILGGQNVDEAGHHIGCPK